MKKNCQISAAYNVRHAEMFTDYDVNTLVLGSGRLLEEHKAPYLGLGFYHLMAEH